VTSSNEIPNVRRATFRSPRRALRLECRDDELEAVPPPRSDERELIESSGVRVARSNGARGSEGAIATRLQSEHCQKVVSLTASGETCEACNHEGKICHGGWKAKSGISPFLELVGDFKVGCDVSLTTLRVKPSHLHCSLAV
jgi:hypothetical protein